MTTDYVSTLGNSIIDEKPRSADRYPAESQNHIEHQLLGAMLALRDGDFSRRLPIEWSGMHGRIAEIFNEIMRMNERREREIKRIAHLVGKEGKFKQRINAIGLSGGWAGEVFDLNTLINDLMQPMTELSRVIDNAVKGEISQEMALEVDGRRLEGEFLRFAKLVNTMIGQLSFLLKSEEPRSSSEIGNESTQFQPRQRDSSMDESNVASAHANVTPPFPAITRDEVLSDDGSRIFPEDALLLIVEEDSAYARILQDRARESGYETIVAARGKMALMLAKQHLPDAIFLDISLTDISGWMVLNNLKADPETHHIPVHVIAPAKEHQYGLSRGALSCTLKSSTPEELAACLSRIHKFITPRIKQLLVVKGTDVEWDNITKLLGGDDIEIIGVATGAEALAVMRNNAIDCMVLDLSVPDISGFELVRTIHADLDLSGVPIIVFTGQKLNAEEEATLISMARSIVEKDVRSSERLLYETALFLHRKVSDLSESMQNTLNRMHSSDQMLVGRKVLVVDDDVRNIFALTTFLEEQDAEVICATNGFQAIDVIKKNSDIDLVLMDIMMPEMDGYQTIREIRKDSKFRALPIIALTAKAMKGDREKCLEAGASDYISKPVNTDNLLNTIRFWLHPKQLK